MLELYHYGDSLCSMKTRFCLLEKGVAFESHFIDLLKWEHLTEEYKKLKPEELKKCTKAVNAALDALNKEKK